MIRQPDGSTKETGQRPTAMGHAQRTSVGPAGLVSNIRSSAKRIASNISPAPSNVESQSAVEPDSTLDSQLLGLRRSSTSSTSKSSQASPYKSRTGSSSAISLSQVPDRKPVAAQVGRRQPGHVPHLSLPRSSNAPSSLDGALVGTSGHLSTFSPSMSSTMTSQSSRYDSSRPPSTSQSNVNFGMGGNTAIPVPALPPPPVGLSQNPNTIYQQIYDVASKRISTLDYLRKA